MSVNISRLLFNPTFTTSGMTAVQTGPTQATQGVGTGLYGYSSFFKVKIPTFANLACSAQVSVLDPDGDTAWKSATLACPTTLIVTGAAIPFVGGENVYVTLTANPSGAATNISVACTVVFTVVID